MTKNEYKVVISSKSKEMMEKHFYFLAQVDKNAAINKIKQIIQSLDSLKQFPYRFPFFNEDYIPANKYRKMFIEHYLVLFQVKENIVYVDYILDCRQNYNWILK